MLKMTEPLEICHCPKCH